MDVIDTTSLQELLNSFVLTCPGSSGSALELKANSLLLELLKQRELGAFLRVYDTCKANKIKINDSVRIAMARLHDKGKGKVSYKSTLLIPLVSVRKRRLKPQRRLHKIVMGSRRGDMIRKRHLKAKPHLTKATAWLSEETNRPLIDRVLQAGNGLRSRNGRMAFARLLRSAINVDMDTALGLVTMIKRSDEIKIE